MSRGRGERAGRACRNSESLQQPTNGRLQCSICPSHLPTLPRCMTFGGLARATILRLRPNWHYRCVSLSRDENSSLNFIGNWKKTPQEFSLTADLGEQPEAVALRLRQYLNVPLDLQRSWQPNREAMNGWRRALEASGIVVFQMTDVSEDEARGFSIYADTLPAVVVNVKDAPNGRSFTMLHELAHLALREAGICDLREDLAGQMTDYVEVFCNSVAGAALIPRGALESLPFFQSKPTDARWDDAEIDGIARSFRCSREVFVRRLLTLGRVSEPFYREKREQYQVEYFETKKANVTGQQDPARQAVSNLGLLYVRAALDAFSQEIIHAGELAELLGTRLKHLSKIQRFATGA